MNIINTKFVAETIATKSNSAIAHIAKGMGIAPGSKLPKMHATQIAPRAPNATVSHKRGVRLSIHSNWLSKSNSKDIALSFFFSFIAICKKDNYKNIS